GEKILQAVGRFNPAWRTTLETAIAGQLRDAVDSIVNNRHQISHGGQVGITLTSLGNYYRDAQAVVAELKRTCAQGRWRIVAQPTRICRTMFGTAPELALRRALHARGLRFYVDYRK